MIDLVETFPTVYNNIGTKVKENVFFSHLALRIRLYLYFQTTFRALLKSLRAMSDKFDTQIYTTAFKLGRHMLGG